MGESSDWGDEPPRGGSEDVTRGLPPSREKQILSAAGISAMQGVDAPRVGGEAVLGPEVGRLVAEAVEQARALDTSAREVRGKNTSFANGVRTKLGFAAGVAPNSSPREVGHRQVSEASQVMHGKLSSGLRAIDDTVGKFHISPTLDKDVRADLVAILEAPEGVDLEQLASKAKDRFGGESETVIRVTADLGDRRGKVLKACVATVEEAGSLSKRYFSEVTTTYKSKAGLMAEEASKLGSLAGTTDKLIGERVPGMQKRFGQIVDSIVASKSKSGGDKQPTQEVEDPKVE